MARTSPRKISCPVADMVVNTLYTGSTGWGLPVDITAAMNADIVGNEGDDAETDLADWSAARLIVQGYLGADPGLPA